MKTNEHASLPAEAQAYAVSAEVALSYIPAIMFNLQGEPELCQMFAAVMQAQRDGGYADGWNDAKGFKGKQVEKDAG